MRIGKIIRIIRNVPAPVRIVNWPKPKPIPVEMPTLPEKVTVK